MSKTLITAIFVFAFVQTFIYVRNRRKKNLALGDEVDEFKRLCAQKGWSRVVVFSRFKNKLVLGVVYDPIEKSHYAQHFGGFVQEGDFDPLSTVVRTLRQTTGLMITRDRVVGPIAFYHDEYGKVILYDVFLESSDELEIKRVSNPNETLKYVAFTQFDKLGNGEVLERSEEGYQLSRQTSEEKERFENQESQ